VINALINYYENSNANIHRGVYSLSEIATSQFEEARKTVKEFLNARDTAECIFVKGTTEAINLVANSFGEKYINKGDEIVISTLEHHSNIVPWQILCKKKEAKLKIIPINYNGDLELEQLDRLLSEKTKLLAVTHVSNALGTVNPIKDIINLAKKKNIPTLIDGAQSVAHTKIDVQDLDCDFFVFSGHKIYGPLGIGVLYAKRSWLDKMPPYQYGGDMIRTVSFEKTTFNELPYKFEAGTPPIAEAIALKTALDFFSKLDINMVQAHEQKLLEYIISLLSEFKDITLIGNPSKRIGVISFIIKSVHPHDIGSILDQHGVMIRTGHHCCMPIMEFYKIPATARVSVGVYNSEEDIVQLINALHEVRKIFKLK